MSNTARSSQSKPFTERLKVFWDWLSSEGCNDTAPPTCLTGHQCALGFVPRQPQQSGALRLERKESRLFVCAQRPGLPLALPSSGVAASRPEWLCFIFAPTLWPRLHARSCLTSPCKRPMLYTLGLSAITPVSFYWVFHGQPGCLELII